MYRKTAIALSVLLHPLVMPLAGLSILFFSGSYVSFLPIEAKKLILILFASGTLILPALMIPLIYFRGTLMMEKQNERNIPLALTFIFYLLTYILFLKVPVYNFLHNFMLGALLSVLASLIINLRWKISIHMIGLGGITAFLLISAFTRQINVMPWILVSILASGIAGTARLYLNSHTPGQIYMGYFAGILIMSASTLLTFSNI